MAQRLATDKEKEELYQNIKSGAESGWDFSGRWFILPIESSENISRNMTHISAKYIIPVDLNAIIERNAKRLSKFHKKFKNYGVSF